jgi:hypothetical protein
VNRDRQCFSEKAASYDNESVTAPNSGQILIIWHVPYVFGSRDLSVFQQKRSSCVLRVDTGFHS